MSGQFLKNDRKGAEGEIFSAFLFLHNSVLKNYFAIAAYGG